MRHCCRWKLFALVFVIPTSLAAQNARRLPVPDAGAVESARTKVREVFAKEYRDAKTAEGKWNLAEQMLKRAGDIKDTPANRFALFVEARDLYTQVGDMLSAFRVVDEMAKVFEQTAFAQKIDLRQSVAKLAKSPFQHRSLAVVALKLSNDAARVAEYDVAKECCHFAVSYSRSATEPALQTRAVEQLRRSERLFNEWEASKAAQQKLKVDPTDAAANLALGRYLCFVRREWSNGLPLLRQSSDPDLAALATSDLKAPTVANEQTLLATNWLQYAERQKEEFVRVAAADRAAIWFERAMQNLASVERAAVDPQLETAYQLACGRNFKKLLARAANGVEANTAVDCSKQTHPLKLKPSFDLRKSWLLSLEFKPRDLNGGWHQVFFWGDGRGGRDPLFLRQDGALLWACTEDTALARAQCLAARIPQSEIGQWADIKFIHDRLAGEFELYVNHRLIQREAATITPTADRRMPLILGGTDGGDQRFTGEVRKVYLGNIP